MLARGTRATLGSYRTDDPPRERRIGAVAIPDGSVLVLDYEMPSCADPRVLARIAPEEPPGNAQLVADLYLADTRRGRSRPLTLADLEGSAPASRPSQRDAHVELPTPRSRQIWVVSSIRANTDAGEFPQLRWMELAETPGESFGPVTLREVIGALERYEPAIAMTRSAIDAQPPGGAVSTATLRAELHRMQAQRDRAEPWTARSGRPRAGLRDVAQRDRACAAGARNATAAETSAARRAGSPGASAVCPESGKPTPTPWVHTSTLALIAREGLRVSPREVEL